MAIGLRGIRLKNCTIAPDDKGENKVSGSYDLMSTTDKVLASQAFNCYGSMSITPSSDTMKALNAFFASLQNDITITLGLGE